MEHLHPKVLITFFLKNLISTVHVIPIWFIAVSIFERVKPIGPNYLPFEQIVFLLNGAGIIFLILLIIGNYYWAWLSFTTYTYELQNDGLHIHRGILIRRNIRIPYTAIENIQLYINPFVVKFLELYSLNIKTRQLENTEGIFQKAKAEIIPGLTQDKAQALRNELIKLSHIQPTKKIFFDPTTGQYH